MHAVHDRDRPARIERSGATEAPESPERLSELEVEIRTLRYELGLSRGRLELTEQAESTLREALDRERERADAEREVRCSVADYHTRYRSLNFREFFFHALG
jgi:hypothetical protein